MARVEVVNYYEPGIYQVDVGEVAFTQNLGGCAAICSTGFAEVTEGANPIVVHSQWYAEPFQYGSLGWLSEGNSYSVEVTDQYGITPCVHLWQRVQTDVSLYDDSGRSLLNQIGYCEHNP